MSEPRERWREDFPVRWDEDHYMTRRELAKFLTLGSGLLAGVNVLIAFIGLTGHPPATPVSRIAGVDEVPVLVDAIRTLRGRDHEEGLDSLEGDVGRGPVGVGAREDRRPGEVWRPGDRTHEEAQRHTSGLEGPCHRTAQHARGPGDRHGGEFAAHQASSVRGRRCVSAARRGPSLRVPGTRAINSAKSNGFAR